VRQEYAVKAARDYWSALELLQGREQTRSHLPGRLFFNLEDPRAKTIIGLLCASEEAADLTPIGPIALCDRARVEAGINAGHEALGKYYPEAAEAFNLLVSSILAIRVSGLSSGSHEHSIGMFWISPTASWIISDYAFAIAHETVHQLLFLENMVNRLFSCNRSELSCADALVSSPIRAQPRPFDLAFHAACVATVLSHLSTSTRFDRFDPSVHERLRQTLTELDRKRCYLTDHGKNLLDDVSAQAVRITTEFGAERPC
jgi:HEXXH motif-containing protein